MSFLWQARSMHGVGTLQGKAMRKLALLAVSACLCAGLLLAALAESGSAAGLLGKDGRVYACYRTKGKAKGSVRLVAKRKHCRKGEKKISWNRLRSVRSFASSASVYPSAIIATSTLP